MIDVYIFVVPGFWVYYANALCFKNTTSNWTFRGNVHDMCVGTEKAKWTTYN